MLRVSLAIQAHPSRAELAEALVSAVGGEIVYDPEPDGYASPWRTYRQALATTPGDATHRIVLQDDVTVCRGFLEAATRAIRARPDVVVTFFVGGRPAEHANAVFTACDRDESWTILRHDRWCPAVALCWPVALIEPMLSYVEAQNWPPAFRADDEMIGRFLREKNINANATVPSLVEHEDKVPSLLGRGRNWAGEDAGRVAACFIADECDALQIDWD